MIISREYTVEPKTSLVDKIIDPVKLGKGTLTKISFHSASGVNGEVYVRIIHFEDSLVPNETDEWIPLTGTRQEYHLQFSNWQTIPVVTIEICAPDARFTHKINIEIELTEELTLPQLFKAFIKGGLKSQNH